MSLAGSKAVAGSRTLVRFWLWLDRRNPNGIGAHPARLKRFSSDNTPANLKQVSSEDVVQPISAENRQPFIGDLSETTGS